MSKIKTLEMDESTALRLYKTAAPEFKEMLEMNFGKNFFMDKPIQDEIGNYDDVIKKLGINPNKDVISVDGFTKDETNVVENIIKKIRICKVYNEGWLPKTAQDKRWFAWYTLSSGSGLVFLSSHYADDSADASSAARLCLKNRALNDDFVKKFKYVDDAIIGL